VDLKSIGLPMVVVYLLADVGSIVGGWLSTYFVSRGFSLNKARKSAMLACALAIVPVVMAPHVEGKWVAVFLVGAATAGHQGFSANLMTLPSDLFPRKAVASVFGIGGFAGAMSGFCINLGAGWVKEHTGTYAIMFAIAGCAYITALGVIHLLVPRLEPAKVA
ncbi:MAG TPA: MFS transporter, partial [Polyangiaceae bacterium]|nr:MFS transporter [Polyangiaceae bacterium]